MLHKLLNKMEREESLPNSFYEASINLITNLDKDIHTQNKEHYRSIS
jgi:hypothetical protein